MNAAFEIALKKLQNENVMAALSGIRRGFEKECLRVDKSGHIAMTPHPKALGSNLTHPMITTDFAESLLEFVTPPMSNITDLFSCLLELHQYTYASLDKDKESLWGSSMPCHLPKDSNIAIAQYGTSNPGVLKYYYRVGLGHRYGKRMQMIAGVHYNFSFSRDFWRVWKRAAEKQLAENSAAQSSGDTTKENNFNRIDIKNCSEKDFISESYLGMIRNAFRLGWLLPLLFGASPAMAAGFINAAALKGSHTALQSSPQDTLFLPYATSLRLSDFGYQNKTKPIVEVSYNSFPAFLKSLDLAVHTRDPEFAKIGIKVNGKYQQLSDCVLQVEDEHYALLRPKRVTGSGERMLPALEKEGIEYLEIRALDLAPFSALGIETETVYILDTFLILCLLLDSPLLTKEEQEKITINHQRVVKEGRKPGLKLMTAGGEERLMLDLCHDMLAAMKAIADCLDKAYQESFNEKPFSKAIRKAEGWVADFNTLPSAGILAEMLENQESYCKFANRHSQIHEELIKKLAFNEVDFEKYAKEAEQSLEEQKIWEQNNRQSFDEYLQKFLEP